MFKKFLSGCVLALASLAFVPASANAVEGNLDFLMKPTAQNPSLGTYRYIARGTKTIFIAGQDGYSFKVGGCDEQRFKNGSFIYVVIFKNMTNNCSGDVFYEYDAAAKISRLTELCRVHGFRPLNQKQIPSIQKSLGFTFQVSDKRSIPYLLAQ